MVIENQKQEIIKRWEDWVIRQSHLLNVPEKRRLVIHEAIKCAVNETEDALQKEKEQTTILSNPD